MDKPLILTLDAGTTGIKCAVFAQDGTAQYACTEEYPTYYLRPGWAQQRPKEQLDAAVRVIRQAVGHTGAERIAAMVFTGHMNGCIPIDRQGEALYDNIIHSDVRAGEQTQHIASCISMEECYRLTGNRIDVRSGLPKYLWLKEHEPQIYERAWKFVNIKDYLYGQFTGCPGGTDRSDASLCNCLNISQGEWAWELLKETGIDVQKMPVIRESTDVSGRLTPAFARLTGLSEGLPVAVGGGDGACAAHGARQHCPGDSYMNIGSTAWVSSMSRTPVLDAQARVFNYFDLDAVSYNVCGTVQCGASAFNWAAEHLLGQTGEKRSIDEIERLARQAEPGAEGLFFLPMLMGERTP